MIPCPSWQCSSVFSCGCSCLHAGPCSTECCRHCRTLALARQCLSGWSMHLCPSCHLVLCFLRCCCLHFGPVLPSVADIVAHSHLLDYATLLGACICAPPCRLALYFLGAAGCMLFHAECCRHCRTLALATHRLCRMGSKTHVALFLSLFVCLFLVACLCWDWSCATAPSYMWSAAAAPWTRPSPGMCLSVLLFV